MTALQYRAGSSGGIGKRRSGGSSSDSESLTIDWKERSSSEVSVDSSTGGDERRMDGRGGGEDRNGDDNLADLGGELTDCRVRFGDSATSRDNGDVSPLFCGDRLEV